MRQFFKPLALAIGAMAMTFSTNAALANTSDFYASVKGWNVVSVQNGAQFVGCHAEKSEYGRSLLLGVSQGLWHLAAPTGQIGRFGGAVLSIDKVDIDSQFGFDQGLAIRELSPSELYSIKRGRQLGVHIRGDAPMWWSLSGSTAAILKVQECADRQGRQGYSQPAIAPPAAGRFVPPNLQGFRASIQRMCSSPTSMPYPCTIEQFSAPAGYTDAFRISPNVTGQPAYFFKIINDTQSEAWIAFDGPWSFAGVWQSQGANDPCANPSGRQGPMAQQTLGQDAWGICVR